MTKLFQTASLTTLILLLSGCSFNSANNPSKPNVDENLQVIDYDSIKSISDITSIAFEWKKVDDPNVIGYNFYRANMHQDGRRLKLIKTLDSKYMTHFVDTKLEANSKYVYQISSKGVNGLESKTTQAYFAQTLQRVPAVSFVQAIPSLPKRIKLVWRPHQDLRVKYYKIERKNPNFNDWQVITKIKGRLQSEFIDKKLKDNETFNYRITAYTHNDIPSEVSQIVTAKTKSLPIGPKNTKASVNEPRKIILTWEPSETQDVIKYFVYRSPFKSMGYTKQAEVSSNTLSYEDKINEDGKDYYYKVTSLDKDELESSDNIESITGMTLKKPSAPVITLAQIQGHKAILNWSSTDNRAISFNVYKKTKLSFWEYKMEKFKNIKGLRFEDNNIVSGVVYKYSIEANDEYGLVSNQTDEAELILPKIKNIVK